MLLLQTVTPLPIALVNMLTVLLPVVVVVVLVELLKKLGYGIRMLSLDLGLFLLQSLILRRYNFEP
jgi:hypothetical protein